MTLKIVNELGSDKASFFFNILDVPGPPTGPIVFEDITGNSVTITWKKPLDNGGSPITGYAIEKKDLDHLGGWVPAVNHIEPYTFTATVPRLLEGTQYEFRVFAINDQGRSIPLPTDEPVTMQSDAVRNQFRASRHRRDDFVHRSDIGQIIEDAREAIVSHMIADGPGLKRTPAVHAALRGWLHLVEGMSLDWLETREVTRPALVEILTSALWTIVETAMAVDAGEPAPTRVNPFASLGEPR